jgi:hypothetical protein
MNTKKYLSMSFFKIIRIEWMDDNRFIVVGNKNYDSKESLYVMDIKNMRIINSITFQGKFQDLFVFKQGERVLFSENQYTTGEVALYAVENKRKIRLISKSIPIPSVHIEYNKEHDIAYVTDSRVKTAFYKSPFVIKLRLGKTQPVFPNYPFYVYSFNFHNKRLNRIRKFSEIRNLQTNAIKKYYLFSEQITFNTQLNNMVKNAEIYDISSNEEVKLFTPDDLSGFILYYSDLDICFKGILFVAKSNQTIDIKSEEVLGTPDYIGMEVIELFPEGKEILFITKDENKTLIKYNYETKIINKLASKFVDYHYNRGKRELYILKEKNKMQLWPKTELQIISLNPFVKKIIKENKFLKKIHFSSDRKILFDTFTGELLSYDLFLPEKGFKYLQPSFDTVVRSRRKKKTESLVFINKRLIYIK